MEVAQRIKKTTNEGTSTSSCEEFTFHKGLRISKELPRSRRKITYHYYGKVGHMAKDCWHKKRVETSKKKAATTKAKSLLKRKATKTRVLNEGHGSYLVL